MLAVTFQFHDEIYVRVRLKDGECCDMLYVEQGLRQACVLVQLLSNMCFAATRSSEALRRVAEKHLIADATI